MTSLLKLVLITLPTTAVKLGYAVVSYNWVVTATVLLTWTGLQYV